MGSKMSIGQYPDLKWVENRDRRRKAGYIMSLK